MFSEHDDPSPVSWFFIGAAIALLMITIGFYGKRHFDKPEPIIPVTVTVVHAYDGATCYIYPDHGVSCLPPTKEKP